MFCYYALCILINGYERGGDHIQAGDCKAEEVTL